MAENTKITWAHSTFSPVRGCRHAILPDGTTSPACNAGPGCYAESMAKRNPATLGEWGADRLRAFGGESYWKQPVKWNADAEKAGERRRVFCASLADIFEGTDVGGVESRTDIRADYLPMLTRLWALIEATPWLDWLLLTKRPWNFAAWTSAHGCPANVWAGTTVENQAAADDRIAYLLRVPATVRFLSMEPLFERVDLDKLWCHNCETDEHVSFEPPAQPWCSECDSEVGGAGWLDALAGPRQAGCNWIIVGGQSGPNAAALDMDAVRDIVRQCSDAGVSVFVKQLGSRWAKGNGSATRAGTNPSEWPEELRVQEFPEVPRG